MSDRNRGWVSEYINYFIGPDWIGNLYLKPEDMIIFDSEVTIVSESDKSIDENPEKEFFKKDYSDEAFSV